MAGAGVGREPRYDAFAGEFAEYAEDGWGNAYFDRPAVLDLLGDVRGLRVLDAGCGPGLYALALVERGAEVHGFDQSAEMVSIATRRLGDRATFRRHDLADPLDWVDDQAYDLVVAAQVLHYVDDRVRTLRELYRVLRPGGGLVLSTVHPHTEWRLRHGQSYFDVECRDELLEERWPVRFWYQPIQAWFDEFVAAGFAVRRLVEPQPVAALRDRDPRRYRQFTHRPLFLAFHLVRPA